MNVLLLDNYDSFTYNLAYQLYPLVDKLTVIRNDKIKASECLEFDAIILSPGPGLPQDAGNMPKIIEIAAGKTPTLGICLGHQGIGQFAGAKLINLKEVHHGKQSQINIEYSNSILFEGIPSDMKVGRYHSWVIDPFSLDKKYNITAMSSDDCIMGIENQMLKQFGVQFHPESILTPNGKTLIQNFIKHAKKR